MKSGNIIIGTFVKKLKILSFLEFLHNKMHINIEKVFIFEVEENTAEYLVTFSTQRSNTIYPQLHDATVLHVKNGCLFSINALNKYIDEYKDDDIDNYNYDVNWGELKNTLLVTSNGTLKISKLSKIDNNCGFISNILLKDN